MFRNKIMYFWVYLKLIQMTVSQFLRSNQIVAIALILGQVLFIIITTALHFTNMFPAVMADSSRILLPIAALATLFAVWANNNFYRKDLEQIKMEKSLTKKLELFRTAFVKRYAILEGPSFFCIVSYLLTGRISFLFFSVLLMGIQFINFPRKDKIVFDLELGYDHQKYFNNPDTLIDK